MRSLRLTLFGLAALLLASSEAWSQFDRGSRGRGGDPNRGGRSSSGDPNAFFDSMANGKDVLIRSEMDPARVRFFDNIAERSGITNGQITRAQFLSYMERRNADRASRMGGPPGTPPIAPPVASPSPAPTETTPSSPAVVMRAPDSSTNRGGFNPEMIDSWAENSFRRLDLNGDGDLNHDEMPDDLRAEWKIWDTNGNGLIDLNEYKAFFRAKLEQRMADRAQAGYNAAMPNSPMMPYNPGTPPSQQKTKPLVYRSANLPLKDLPPWFKQIDINQDAQISLYEWQIAGRNLDEFQQIDTNNDGFLSVDEVARWWAKNKGSDAASRGGTVVARQDNSTSVQPVTISTSDRPPPGQPGQRGPRSQRRGP
jgi:Ca2+-binding EF-hand superfamily protein